MALDGNTFVTLPDAVVVHVFSYLPKAFLVRCSLVSKRWHRVCFDASLWRNVCIPFNFRHNVEDSTLTRLLACSRNVNKLCLVECQSLTDELLGYVSTHCPNLKKLQLCGCTRISDKGMSRIARRCKQLTKVGIAKTKVTDRSLNTLIENNSHLTSLEVSTQACTSETFKRLAVCKSLRKLKVYETPEEVLVKRSRIFLNDEMLTAVGRSCSSLTHLVLAYDYVETTDKSMRELAMGCSALENFEVDCCPEVGDIGIIALVENCPGLEHLHLGESRATDATVRAIATYLPKIRSLKLGHSDVTDNGVFCLMGRCKFLEELSLGVKIPENLTDITASVISCLSGPLLCSLEFNSCAITDRGLAILVNNSVRLTSLTIEACSRITFDGLMNCLGKCTELRLLDVSFSGVVQNAKQLIEIADGLPNLRTLGVVDAERITERDLELFQSRYPLCDVRL